MHSKLQVKTTPLFKNNEACALHTGCAPHRASIGGQCCRQAVAISSSSSKWLLQPAACTLLLLTAGARGPPTPGGPLAHTSPPLLLLLLLLFGCVPPRTPSSSPCCLHLYLCCCCCCCSVCELCAGRWLACDFVCRGHVPAADGSLKGVQPRVGGFTVHSEVPGTAEGLCN
jgi:hypothetical protein